MNHKCDRCEELANKLSFLKLPEPLIRNVSSFLICDDIVDNNNKSDNIIKQFIKENPKSSWKAGIYTLLEITESSYISGTNKSLYNLGKMNFYILKKFVNHYYTQFNELYENLHSYHSFNKLINEYAKDKYFNYGKCRYNCMSLFQEVLYRFIIERYERGNKYSEYILKQFMERLKLLDNPKHKFVLDIDKTLERYYNKEYRERIKASVRKINEGIGIQTFNRDGSIYKKINLDEMD